MEPELQTTESVEETKQNYFNKVTPLSKYLAMTFFVVLPFVGGWIGYKFAPEKVVEVEKVVIKEAEKVEENNESHIQEDSTHNVTEEYFKEFKKQSEKTNWQILDQLDVGEYDAIIAAPFRVDAWASSKGLIEKDNCYYPQHYVLDDAVLFYATSSLKLGEIGVPLRAYDSWWTVSTIVQGGMDNGSGLIQWRLLGISNHLKDHKDNNSFSVLDYAKLKPRSVQESLEGSASFLHDKIGMACQWEGSGAVRKFGYFDRVRQDDVGRELIDREEYGEIFGENHDEMYIHKNYSVNLEDD